MSYPIPPARFEQAGPTRSIDWLQVSILIGAALVGSLIALSIYAFLQERNTRRLLATLKASPPAQPADKPPKKRRTPPPTPRRYYPEEEQDDDDDRDPELDDTSEENEEQAQDEGNETETD